MHTLHHKFVVILVAVGGALHNPSNQSLGHIHSDPLEGVSLSSTSSPSLQDVTTDPSLFFPAA